MIKKLFSMMACAALVFGMAACSEEDPAPNKGNGGNESGGGEVVEPSELFPEGYYMAPFKFDNEGYPTKDGVCVMYLEQNAQDENAYALYYPMNIPVLLLAEVGDGTIDPKRDELVFDGSYLYYDENEQLAASEISFFDVVVEYWSYEMMISEMGYTQDKINDYFLADWPESEGLMFYVAPYNYSNTENGLPLLAATEFRICSYFVEDFDHYELVFANNLSYCYQGVKLVNETELQPVNDIFYGYSYEGGLYAGMMMYECVVTGEEEVDLADRYYNASSLALTRGMMLKKNLVEKNTFTPSKYKRVR